MTNDFNSVREKMNITTFVLLVIDSEYDRISEIRLGGL